MPIPIGAIVAALSSGSAAASVSSIAAKSGTALSSIAGMSSGAVPAMATAGAPAAAKVASTAAQAVSGQAAQSAASVAMSRSNIGSIVNQVKSAFGTGGVFTSSTNAPPGGMGGPLPPGGGYT